MYSPNQLAVCDAIDELNVGEGVEFTNGVFVERESPTRFVIDGKEMCFVEACDIAVVGIN
jgi:hypothetical protein